MPNCLQDMAIDVTIDEPGTPDIRVGHDLRRSHRGTQEEIVARRQVADQFFGRPRAGGDRGDDLAQKQQGRSGVAAVQFVALAQCALHDRQKGDATALADRGPQRRTDHVGEES